MTPDAIHVLFATLSAACPQPQMGLVYASHFELLVAVMLSAQATDVSVNRVTPGLFQAANTPAKMLQLGLPALTEHLRPIGLYHSKARHLMQTCQILVERHDGRMPSTRADLQALPGVGRKTANVVLNAAFGQPVVAVDTHIFRLCNRTGLAPGRTPEAVEMMLYQRVPPEFLMNAHLWLIGHGRHVCQARRPRCAQCNVASVCDFETG